MFAKRQQQASFALVILISTLVSPTFAQFIPTGSKAPPSVIENLSAGRSQDVIILFDDSAIAIEAAGLREQRHEAVDDRQIHTLKAQRFAALKQGVIAQLQDFEILRDYDMLPSTFVRLHSLSALYELLKSPEVLGIYEDSPQDALQSELPNLVQIDQPAAVAAGDTGVGTTVAVIDTGTDYTNPAFGPCSAPGNPFDCKVVYFQDFCCTDGLLDGNGHGTNVAAIVLEVAPGTRIAALKVLSASGTGSDSTVIAGINWAIANKFAYNIVAMNLSLGVTGSNNPSPCTGSNYAAYFANARAAGILPAVAAGNDGFSNGVGSPACAPGAVSVGAVTMFDQRAIFSDIASYLSLFAPGVNIYGAGTYYSGTSQATPHVAGAAAVLRAQYPSESVDTTVSRMATTGKQIYDTTSGFTIPRLDLYAATLPPPLAVSFEPLLNYGVGSAPYGIATGEFNGDGRSDIVVANYSSNSMSALFSHSGGFLPQSTAPVGANPLGIAVGDFDNDGNLDVAVGNYGAATLTVLLGHGNGTFTALAQNNFPVGSHPEALAVGDFNNDGTLDIATANYSSNTISVLLGVGNGTFLPQVTAAVQGGPVGIAAGDFNRDGKLDLVVANYASNTVSVLLGNGTGAFTPQVTYPVGANPYGIAVADLDGNGIIDLVVANYGSATISILRGNGDGTFLPQVTLPVGSGPSGVAIADLNEDGAPDIIVANRNGNDVGVLLGNRYHTFQPQMIYGTAAAPTFLAVADFNYDRHLDVAVTSNTANGVSVLLNRTFGDDTIFANGFQ